jgi:2-polyprenyl-6-methoxyphenol hydroxylase-like FAD-dependent oxidoreductase
MDAGSVARGRSGRGGLREAVVIRYSSRLSRILARLTRARGYDLFRPLSAHFGSAGTRLHPPTFLRPHPGGRAEPAMHVQSAAPERRVIIVGAGLAGSLLAVLLGRRGWAVEVLERRGDPRAAAAVASEQRSINLGLSHRGMVALRQAGVLDEVMKTAVRAKGRVIHASDARVEFQPYGQSEHEVLHSIQRSELNRALIDRAEEVPGVVFRFGVQLDGMDREAATVDYLDADGTPARAQGDFVVGADGAFSSVRQWMQRGSRADYAQEFLEWGYKELTLPAAPGGGSQVELEALHIWPRGDCLIVSHPNQDGSHTLTLFLPWEGRRSFAVLQTPEDVTAFFANLFPDLPPLAPALAVAGDHAHLSLAPPRQGGAGGRRVPRGLPVLRAGDERGAGGLPGARRRPGAPSGRPRGGLPRLPGRAQVQHRRAGGAGQAELRGVARYGQPAAVPGPQAAGPAAQPALSVPVDAAVHHGRPHDDAVRRGHGAPAQAGAHPAPPGRDGSAVDGLPRRRRRAPPRPPPPRPRPQLTRGVLIDTKRPGEFSPGLFIWRLA